MQVNIVALTLLTRALLPAMIKAQKRGAILNVSSSAGFLPIPNMAVYAATKAYVTSFSEALRAEVAGHGNHVSALCPGPVHTEFDEVARRSEFARETVAGITMSGRGGRQRRACGGRGEPADRHSRLGMKIGMALVRLTPMPILRSKLAACSQQWRR